MAPLLAPLDGSLSTLVDFVDFHADNNPDLPWLVFPSASNGELSHISFAAMAKASHQIAHILRPEKCGQDGQLVIVLLHTDTAIYVAIMLGIIRAGYIPYPMSPRNSVEGLCHMLNSTASMRVLCQPSTVQLVKQVQSDAGFSGTHLEVDDISIFHDILLELIGVRDPMPLSKGRYPSAGQLFTLDDPLWYLHSSGSTGLPKSVPFPRHQVLQNLRRHLFGTRRNAVRFGAMGLPTFHSMGLLLQMFFPLCSSQGVAVFTPQYPAPPTVPTPSSIYETCRITQCEGLIAPPSFIEVWSHSEEIVDYLKGLQVLVFGGGPLSLTIGDKLANIGVPLYCGYGGSEFGSPTQSWDEIPQEELRNNQDWSWMRFPASVRLEWVPHGNGTHELVVYDTDQYKVRFANINRPGERGCSTADLFEPHPSRNGLWRLVGRKDDVIPLSTGEKIVPVAQEGRVNASPLVSGCVMFGWEQAQAGLLIEIRPEYRDNGNTLAEMRNRLWSAVEHANNGAPAFAKIYKEMLLVTDPAKPLPRSAKNTVIRNQAIAIYSEEINALYTTIKDATQVTGISPPKSWDIEELLAWLLKHIFSLIGTQPLSPSINLFHQGLDSLSGTFLRNRIVDALRSSGLQSLQNAARLIPSNFVFEHPTIEQLAKVLNTYCAPHLGLQELSLSSIQVPHQDEIDTLLDKYVQDIATPIFTRGEVKPGPRVVLLTGSTGNIGSHVLASLLADDGISRVFTLNRSSSDPTGRLRSAFTNRGLPTDLLDEPKLVALVGNVMRDRFDLEQEQYDEILQSVTHIIHNAWSVNFNLPLQAFKDQILGVRKLIDLCALSNRPIRLLQTSSIGVVNGWSPESGPIPESPLPTSTLDFSTMNGYRASKYIIEQICQAAAVRGISVMTVRMGQACGPRATGAWGTSEWFPIMVKSSVALGCFPEITGSVAWVPLDAIGQAYVDWVISNEELPELVNVVHSRPLGWNIIARGVCEELGTVLHVIPLDKWVSRLEECANSATLERITQIPALQILDFFRHLASASSQKQIAAISTDKCCTGKLQRSSPTMRGLQRISEDHVRMWVRFWRESGYIL